MHLYRYILLSDFEKIEKQNKTATVENFSSSYKDLSILL